VSIHLAHKGRGSGYAASVATNGVLRPMLALLRVFPESAYTFLRAAVVKVFSRGPIR
jgi:hypothetical protein